MPYGASMVCPACGNTWLSTPFGRHVPYSHGEWSTARCYDGHAATRYVCVAVFETREEYMVSDFSTFHALAKIIASNSSE